MIEPVLSSTDGGALVHVTGAHGSYIVNLDPDADFDSIRAELRRVLAVSAEQYKSASVRIDIGRRRLELFDVRRLVNLFREEFGAMVTAIYVTRRELHRYVEHEMKLRVLLKEELVEEDTSDVSLPLETHDGETTQSTQVEFPASEVELGEVEDDDSDLGSAPENGSEALAGQGNRLLIVDKTLRGGGHVRFAGDVVVYGDVNAGAQIVAGGNILVLGSLRGLAHAGSPGNERAVIISFDLRPTQLRIGNKIAMPPDEGSVPPKGMLPQIAWVAGEGICIEAYSGRLPF